MGRAGTSNPIMAIRPVHLLYNIEYIIVTHIYIYIYIYIYIHIIGIYMSLDVDGIFIHIRPVHLLRVSLLRVLESNFPGDSLSNSTDMRIPTP